jgi:hypothetical protein
MHSSQAISRTSENCIMNMGHHLSREYEYFYCNILNFIVPQTNTSEILFKVVDATSSNTYNTDVKININAPLGICNVVAQGKRLGFNHTTENNIGHVIKNWNGKRINFRFVNIKTNKLTIFANDTYMHWLLLLAITPVYPDKLNQMAQYIYYKQYESFNYFISTVSRISTSTIQEPIIDIPAINTNHTEYFCNSNCLKTDYDKNTV